MKAAAAICVGSLVLTVASADAQKASTEWRTKPAQSRFRSTTNVDAAREMAGYARCVASARRDGARALVLAPYGSAEQAAAAQKVVRSGGDPCIVGSYSEMRLQFNGQVMAGALAQALVLKEYSDLPSVIASYAPTEASEKSAVTSLSPAEILGRCVVQRNPSGSLALISAPHGTAAEDEAMRGLGGDLSSCLTAGSTLRVNRLFIRAVTGVAAYRLAQQIRPRGAGPVSLSAMQ